jgi:hypothetical protein
MVEVVKAHAPVTVPEGRKNAKHLPADARILSDMAVERFLLCHARSLTAVILAGLWALCALACEDKRVGVQVPAQAASTASPGPTFEALQAPLKTNVSVDEAAVSINAVRIVWEGPSPRTRIATELLQKPGIAGETVLLVAARNVRASHLALTIAALRDAKAKDVEVRSPRRDASTASVVVGWERSPPCTVLAAIGRDVAISVGSLASNGQGRRYAKGMAGPDLTLGSDAIRKATAGGCEAKLIYLGADETVAWGLVFDLALASSVFPDGSSAHIRRFGLLQDTMISGPASTRKVTPLLPL